MTAEPSLLPSQSASIKPLHSNHECPPDKKHHKHTYSLLLIAREELHMPREQVDLHLPGEQVELHLPGEQVDLHMPGEQVELHMPGEQVEALHTCLENR